MAVRRIYRPCHEQGHAARPDDALRRSGGMPSHARHPVDLRQCARWLIRVRRPDHHCIGIAQERPMIRNIGPVDRAIRIVIGILLLSWLVLGVGPWHWLGLIGVVPLGTALVRWCPLYS